MENQGKNTILEKEQKNYARFEYKDVVADGQLVPLLLDGYENFGWELNDSPPGSNICGRPGDSSKTIIRLKRDRKILNKAELTRLQRNFEACVSQIQTLEQRKTSTATAFAIMLGVFGTAFMAGSVFAVTAQPPHYILCILFAIPGFMGWIFPYLLYRKIVENKTEKIVPLIEAKFDEIHEISEKGSKLLY